MMKIRPIVLGIILLFGLAACSGVELPFEIPALPGAGPVDVSEPAATATATPTYSRPTVAPTATATPRPTRKSPYPVGAATGVLDIGFQPIQVADAADLKPVMSIPQKQIWQSMVSADGQKLFVATSNGIYVYHVGGGLVTNWPELFTISDACAYCMAVNGDGSRFALVARNVGEWEIQIFDVAGIDATIRLTIPVTGAYTGTSNEARLALSPDGNLLAYSIGEDTLSIIDIATGGEVFSYSSSAETVSFSPASTWLVIRNGHILTLYPTQSWKNAITLNISSPSERGEFAISPDEKSIAFLTSSRLKVYSLETQKPIREVALSSYSSPPRSWMIRFNDNSTLGGFGMRWFDFNTRLVLDKIEWDINTGERLRAETQELIEPDMLNVLWGIPEIETPSQDNLELGTYVNFQFATSDMLIINEEHSACWLTIPTGDIRCYKDRNNRVFSSVMQAFRETREKYSTTLTQWNSGETVISTDPRPVMAISRDGNFVIMDIRTYTTDIYVRNFKLPSISIAGPMTTYAENTNTLVIGTTISPGLTAITGIQKVPRNVLFQKRGYLIFKPLAMDINGTVYDLQDDGTGGLVSIVSIAPKTYETTVLTTIHTPARPNAMAEANGVLAIGMQDGSVILANPKLQLDAIFHPFVRQVHNAAEPKFASSSPRPDRHHGC